MLTFRLFLLALLLTLAVAPSALGATDKGAVISNGTIQLGVNATGELNYDCVGAEDTNCPAASLSGDEEVGIRYVPFNADGTGPGCDCEGWGFADAVSRLSGFANQSSGTDHVTVDSFTAAPDGRSAISTVTIAEPDEPDEPAEEPKTDGYKMQVTHDYRPSPRSPNVYEGLVTVTNTGEKAIEDLRYRRVMDWDVEPTAFDEWVTVKGRTPQLQFNSDDGFASSNPLSGRSHINSLGVCGTPEEIEAGSYNHPCEYTDLGECQEPTEEDPDAGRRCTYPEAQGPDDIGALFDFGFGALAVGETKRFKVLYGAAPDEAAATRAMQDVGAEVYSLGQSSCPDPTPDGDDPDDDQPDQTGCAGAASNSGVERGAPVTFMFGFVTTRADVALTKVDARDPVTVGEDITYTLTATNNGPDATSSAEITDTLPDGLELVSATASQGSCSGTKTVVCGLGALGVGASATVTIVARTLATGDVVNAATVTAVSEDPRPENNTATATTRVNPVPPPAPPQPPIVEPPVSPILACTKKKLVLVDVYQASGRVQLLGAADASLVGRTVDLMFTGSGKRVARATVKSDGTFQTTAKLPPRRIRTTNRARYQAVVGKEKSDRLKLVRRVAVTSLTSAGRKITIRGKLSRPLARPVRPIQVYQRVSCTKTKVVKTFKPAKSGAFKVTFDAPAGQDSAVYVLRTFVRKTPRSKRPFLTKSLPRPVFIK